MGKIHHANIMGKSTISMVIFNSYVTNYQRVTSKNDPAIVVVGPQVCFSALSVSLQSSLRGDTHPGPWRLEITKGAQS